MTMRVTITNTEEGFSDARVAIKPPGQGRIVLRGGESYELIMESDMQNQVALQALYRTGESEKDFDL